jgi:hypothetical protein
VAKRLLLALAATVAAESAARAEVGVSPAAPPAAPEATFVEPAAPPDASIALVASGGVSLGAYQAGFLYMALRLQENRFPERRLAVAAGTSAGSANALISALNSCTGVEADPTDDAGWQVWVPVGLDQLFDPERATATSIFTRDGLAASLSVVEDIWQEGLPESCDVVVAFTVTRLRSRGIAVRPDFSVPRQEEKIRLRIQGRGYGEPPRLTNYVDPRFHLEQMVLNLRMDDDRWASAEHNLEQLFSVIFASTGFPIAFEPQRIDYCLLAPAGPDDYVDPDAPYCPEPTHSDLFIDGGVFENYPLRLAERVARDGLRSDAAGRRYWRDLTQFEPESQRRPAPVFYAYVDPFRPAYPPMIDTSSATAGPSMIGLVSSIFGNFVAAARGKELYAAVEESPHLANQMFMSSTSYPTASEPLSAFLGFMERDFREFDYYLGMFDAFVLLHLNIAPGGRMPVTHDVASIPAAWRPLACLLGTYDPAYADLAAACEQGPSPSFLTLLQVSVDRMHDHCRRIRPSDLRLRHPHPRCEGASRGEARPRVAGVAALTDAEVTRREGESHFHHTMRLLETYRFPMDDLGLDADTAQRTRLYIRRKLVAMADAVADRQPTSRDRALIRSAARAGTDGIAYDPPKLLGWVLLGSMIEAGLSGYPSDAWPTWLRPTAALQYKGWTSLFTDEPAHFIGALTAGVEVELQFLSNSLFSPYVGLRGGGQLSTLDGFGTDACTSGGSLGDGKNCSQAVLQTYAAATALGWLRLQIELEIFPAPPVFDVDGDERRSYVGLHFGLGAQFK